MSKQRPSLEFDEPTHTYTCSVVTDGVAEVKTLISASALLGLYKPEFNAEQEINKMFDKSELAHDLEGNQIYLGKKTEYIGMTRQQIKDVWECNRISKSAYGTFIHAQAEKYGEELKSGKKSSDIQVVKRPEINQVKKFFKEYTPVSNERQIYALLGKENSQSVSDGYGGVAGTIDLLVKDKNGDLWLADWKTNIGKDLARQEKRSYESMMNNVLDEVPNTKFWGYALQMSLYRYLLEKTEGIKVKGQFIVHLIGDRETCPYEEMTQKGQRISYKQISTPYMEQEIKEVLKDYFVKKQ